MLFSTSMSWYAAIVWPSRSHVQGLHRCSKWVIQQIRKYNFIHPHDGHMTAAWRPHEGHTSPAQGPAMGCMWDHRFMWNSLPTHNNLALASHHTYEGHIASLQAAGENMGISRPEWGGGCMASAYMRRNSCSFSSPCGYHAAHVWLMCGLCEEHVKDPH